VHDCCHFARDGDLGLFRPNPLGELEPPTFERRAATHHLQEHIGRFDNLSSHKRPKVRELIEAVGATLLYLPPYSPDFNPIEKLFSKLKALLRKAAERTVEGLWRAIDACLDRFSPRECANYFEAAGYEPT
jgi:transposase